MIKYAVFDVPEGDPFHYVWAYDIEVFMNCFTVSFANMVDPFKQRSFVIHDDVNQADELKDFLSGVKGLIGYNNLAFDNPVLQTQIMELRNAHTLRGSVLARRIYDFTQKMIDEEFPPRIKPIIPQRDCYTIWHFDNPAKATSLKWVQVAIGWYNVEDMPVHHTAWVTKGMIPQILSYNMNDVLSTREFYIKKTLPKVKIRKVLSAKYGLNLFNANDPKIGEEIILSRVAKRMGIDLYELKKLRTWRHHVDLKDIILPMIEFKSEPFNRILKRFRELRVIDTRSKEKFEVLFDGMKYVFGFGGLHAARPNQLFQNVDSADVSSFYPNLAIKHKFHPEHLGEDFCIVYAGIYTERQQYPKKSPENEGLKLSLNGVFGKSNSQYSALFDMKMTLQITINGQLLLAMLCEELTLSGAARVIMANTDGIEVIVKDMELYRSICANWERMTQLTLEYSKYKVLAIRDVNNYIAVKPDNSTKEKGAYEVEKEIHKDQSMPIVAKAVREFFQNKTPITETIEKCNDIWEFMMAVRAKTGEFALRGIDPTGDSPEIVDITATKTIRYYIATTGDVMIKKTEKKEGKQHSRVYVRTINQFEEKPFQEYQVNKQFYVTEANKLLVGVTKGVPSLFD